MSGEFPSSNILLDPVTELNAALKSHSFGIDPSSAVITESSFPLTPEDKELVASESKKKGTTLERVVGKARIVLLGGEGEVQVVLDRRGYTVESTMTHQGKQYPYETYESLDALLIAISPAYVEAMGKELMSRFQGVASAAGVVGSEEVHEGWEDVPSVGLGKHGETGMEP